MEEYAPKLLYIEAAILIIILFLLYFAMKYHLKRFIQQSSNEQMLNRNNLNNNEVNNALILINRSRLSFVRTISGGFSSYLIAPFIAFIPFVFNLLCTAIGLEWSQHVLSWYVLSGLLLGVLHIGIYLCGISIVRYSWTMTCCHKMDVVVVDDGEEVVNGDDANNKDMKVCLNEDDKDKNLNMKVAQKRDGKKEFVQRAMQQSTKHYMELV